MKIDKGQTDLSLELVQGKSPLGEFQRAGYPQRFACWCGGWRGNPCSKTAGSTMGYVHGGGPIGTVGQRGTGVYK